MPPALSPTPCQRSTSYSVEKTKAGLAITHHKRYQIARPASLQNKLISSKRQLIFSLYHSKLQRFWY